MMKKWLVAAVLSIVCFIPGAVLADSLADPMADPFAYFNVYSLGNIGSASDAYQSDFQGVAGAAGDAIFSNFSLEGMDSSSGYVLHTGGSADLTGSYLGGIDAGEDLTIGGISIQGDVRTGGDVAQRGGNTNYGGSINGSVYAGGSVTLDQRLTVQGGQESGTDYSSMVDHLALSVFFKSTSETIGGFAATGNIVNHYGALSFEGSSGINVVTIDAGELRDAWGFTVRAPEDAVVYINVVNDDGSPILLDSTGWTYSGGIAAGNVLLNLPTAESLSLTQDNNVNILAPFAHTVFASGVVTGSLIVGNLEGGGQVNLGHFTAGGSAAPAPVPEPATLALMVAGAGVLLGGRKVRRMLSA